MSESVPSEIINLEADTKVIGIKGQRRQGKGIFSTFLGLQLADKGGKILGNYTLFDSLGKGDKVNGKWQGNIHPNFHFISFMDLVNLLEKPRRDPPVSILIDELPVWIDSYCSTSSKANRYASHFLNQSSKLGYNFIYTAQRLKRVDINFREGTDISFQAEKNRENQEFIYHILDPKETEEDIPTGKKIHFPFALARSFWDRYDTFEAVPPIGLHSAMTEIAKDDPTWANAEINRQITLIMQKYPQELPRNTTQATDLLYELGENVHFAGVVCARLVRLQQKKPQCTPKTATPNTATEGPRMNYTEKWLTARIQK